MKYVFHLGTVRIIVVAFLVTVSILVQSCIFEPPAKELPTGQYRGSYSLNRNNPNDKNEQGTTYAESNMTLILNSSTFSYKVVPLGDSITPPASEGTYSLRYGFITLKDRSQKVFRDPSLVMNGEFVYTYDGSSLVMTRKDTVNKREHTLVLMRF